MKNTIDQKLFVLLFSIFFSGPVLSQMKDYNYPKIEKKTVVEDYCGHKVTDDYRNLENLKDSTVIEWFKEQESFTNAILDSIDGKDTIFKKLKDFETKNEFETSNPTVLENGNYFYYKTFAEDNNASIYFKENAEGPEVLLFDPKTYKPEDKKKYSVRDFEPSWDGTKLAVAVTYSGKEFSEALILEVATRKITVDGIKNIWSDLRWLPDNSGITFMALSDDFENSDDHFKNMCVNLYRLGDAPEDAKPILNQKLFPDLKMTDSDIPVIQLDTKNEKYVVGQISGATAYHDTYFCESKNLFGGGKVNWRPLGKKENKVEKFRVNGNRVIALTAEKNENFQIARISLDNIDWNDLEILVTPTDGEVIDDFEITSNGIYYTTSINGVKYKLYRYADGASTEIQLPIDAGYAIIYNLSPKSPDLWVRTMGWLNDYNRYSYDLESDTFNLENLSPLAEYPEFENLAVKEVEVSSHDGAKVPLSIIYRKDIKMDGTTPTLMYGYGSYGISYEPYFSPAWLTWVEMGNVLAFAHVRGGGEKGDAWYQGGHKENKPNTWKDMIACTEYMIDKKYTSKEKTIVQGGSAGGILVGRTITERPDLYAAAITRVGAMNVLRSEDAPNGANNVKEFGSYNNPEECEALLEMDAYEHIEENVSYPATLITAGLNDPRIIAWSPGKFAARLQERNTSDKPILFYVKTDSGHGLGEGKWDYLEEKANLYAFALWQVNEQKYHLKR